MEERALVLHCLAPNSGVLHRLDTWWQTWEERASRLRDTCARAVRNVLGNVYLNSLTKNLWYEEREQLDSGGGGALSQGAGHDGSFYRYAV